MKLSIFLTIIGILFVFCETAGAKLRECDRRGTVRSKHNTNEECKCKANVMGQNCDQCKPNTFDLSRYNPLGCTQCFCMGITDKCQSLNWPKGVIKESLAISGQKNLDDHFVLLPEKFLKNQLLSYGQVLILTIDLIKTVNSAEPIEEADIEIFSETQNMTLSYWYPTPLSESFSEESYVEKVVYLHESSWYLAVDSQISRNQFLMVLAEITAIKIRIEYGTLRCAISEVELQTAAENGSGKNSVHDVEKCDCPGGYTGTSCEKCAAGYTRISVEPYLGKCGPMCNGHAHKWDENTQSCVNCAHNTAGKYCHLCAPGYEGNATTHEGCGLSRSIRNSADSNENQYDAGCICENNVAEKSCDCPDSSNSGRSAKIVDAIELVECDERGSLQLMPDSDGQCQCKDNVMGQICDQCKPNTFALSRFNLLGCAQCFCMGITEKCHLPSASRPTEVISYSRNILHSDERIKQDDDFEVLPEKFLGNRVRFYDGSLRITSYVDTLHRNISIQEGDIEIWSNNKNLRLQCQYLKSGDLRKSKRQLDIALLVSEDRCTSVDGRGISREMFLMALANITAIKIRRRFPQGYLSPYTVEWSSPKQYSPGHSMGYTLGECECPPEYTGTLCEECAFGYIRRPREPYLGNCEVDICNGHSAQLNAETGLCENCLHNTAGEYCHLCAPGYKGNATTEEGCKPSQPPPLSSANCNCNSAGSKNNQCNGDCICKDNVEGEKCDRCKPSTFGLSAENEYGCNKCFCNGITDQCYESSYYVQKISGFGDATTSLRLYNNEPVKGLKIGYSVPENENVTDFTWALPQIYHGNKLKSYGGYLRIIQEIKRSSYVAINPPAIINMHGNGINLIMYTEESSFSGILNYTIPLRETGWKVANENGRNATREDFMKLLENLEIIYVVISMLEKGDDIYMREISMDEAVTIGSPGLDRTTQIEICECPIGYEGDSCERCATAHYRDIKNKKISILGSCERCPCSGEWRDCELSSTGEILCICKDGYSGDDCKADKVGWQLSVNMRVEPERQTVEPGGVATMTCAVDFRDADDEADFLDHERPSLDSQVHLEWRREDNEPLPVDSTISDGILTIYNVQREDTGVYVCHGLKDEVDSYFDESYLHVGIPPKITLNPNDETVDLGDDVSIVCHAFGDPPMTIVWTAMYRDLLPGEVDDGHGRLTFNGIAATDVGRYVCNATNAAGTTSAVAEVLTTLPECF